MPHADITALLEDVINASPNTLLALRYIRDLCTGGPTLHQAVVLDQLGTPVGQILTRNVNCNVQLSSGRGQVQAG